MARRRHVPGWAGTSRNRKGWIMRATGFEGRHRPSSGLGVITFTQIGEGKSRGAIAPRLSG